MTGARLGPGLQRRNCALSALGLATPFLGRVIIDGNLSGQGLIR
jgi:hypothetical protein